MDEIAALKAEITAAFADVCYPGDDHLVDSLGGGEEPALVVEEFRAKDDWQVLTAPFLDQAPDGYGSALSFFTHEALQFYFPAYLMADLDPGLTLVIPWRRLSHAFDDDAMIGTVDGISTWFEHSRDRYSLLTPFQATAILNYLERQQRWMHRLGYDDPRLEQGLRNFWRQRPEVLPAGAGTDGFRP